MPDMVIEAVIFDWGGTLTRWHAVDYGALWLEVCARHFPSAQAAVAAVALCAAEAHLWRRSELSQESATLQGIFDYAGLAVPAGFWPSFFGAWDPHTYTDPDVVPLLTGLGIRGIRVGVLSNTMWPRAAHERVFDRDGVLALLDGAVYTSELPWTKPHPEAFRAAMAAIGVDDPATCVYVGDRPFEDIHGAKSAGMRSVLIPNEHVPPHDSATPDAVISSLSELLPLLEHW
jgi:putative hydrolase of the HAD superfamily